jgi:hypothetical protein
MPSSLPPPPPGWDAAKYKLAYCFSAAHPQESSKPRFSSHVGRRSPLCGRENEPATHPISPAQHGISAIHTPCPRLVRFPGQLRAPRPTVMARMRPQKQNATMFFFSRPHSIRQIANRIAKTLSGSHPNNTCRQRAWRPNRVRALRVAGTRNSIRNAIFRQTPRHCYWPNRQKNGRCPLMDKLDCGAGQLSGRAAAEWMPPCQKLR